ncbi:MAG TPA: hybrid sensor histidine kinase/response regulator, partial [Bacteroidales bacterium]|nr:hybrid sensor histidine kinase/response regulator [Bacteroidales bacterium]
TYNQRPALINITRDITSRKKSEENLRNSEAALRALNATKDKFFSIIAHDLRNPFSSIMGFSEILKDEAESLSIGDIKNYAGMINTAAGQTYRLLENLLEWANMQQGKISFNPKLLVLKEMAIDILETITDTAAMKQISVVSHIPGNLIVRADEEMLRTVLRNLLNNALKFTPAGGTIELLAKKNETGVEVLVKDTGVGISSENLEKLFDVGTSYTTRGTNNEKGTGLGLILCREFVERHGGRISVTSKPGEGSTFTFTLPGKVDSAPEPLSGAKEKFPRSDDHLNRQTILLVEDDPTSALLYRKMLSARFKKVLHAESGFEAIELFNNNPDISLILMDIKMPDMDGNETTQKIRAISKKVIIIALTALASSEERNKALNSGCDEYLTKPVKFDELIAVISNFIPKQN